MGRQEFALFLHYLSAIGKPKNCTNFVKIYPPFMKDMSHNISLATLKPGKN